MRLAITSLIVLVTGSFLVCTGCTPDARLKATLERTEREKDAIERELYTEQQDNAELQRRLAEQELYRSRIAEESQEMTESFEELKAMYDAAVTSGGGQTRPLPAELVAALKDFAENNGELLSYDSTKGLVRLNSDLTFDLGSDKVKAEAEE